MAEFPRVRERGGHEGTTRAHSKRPPKENQVTQLSKKGRGHTYCGRDPNFPFRNRGKRATQQHIRLGIASGGELPCESRAGPCD